MVPFSTSRCVLGVCSVAYKACVLEYIAMEIDATIMLVGFRCGSIV